MSVDTLLKRPQENPVPRLTIAKVQEMLQAMSPLYEIVRLVNLRMGTQQPLQELYQLQRLCFP